MPKLNETYKSLFEKYQINTKLRIAHFMAQIDHESGLLPISENLNYSSIGLINTFSRYFKGIDISTYVRNPEKIANRVYANRMGNKNELSGDGWKYRGRGFIQLTGKSNYIALSKESKIDFVKNPDLLLTEPNALIAALWFCNLKKLNKFADKNDITSITKLINGGLNGFDHRKELLKKYMD
jgi:putative chitinase